MAEERLMPMQMSEGEYARLVDSFEEDCIGRRMTANFVAISRELTVKQAMRSLIRQAADKAKDNISTLYVLREDGAFYGAIDLKDLIIAREDTQLSELISTDYPFVFATQTDSSCMEQLREYEEDTVPVLDEEHRLLGVITAHDLVDVVDEELGEDYARLAGLTAEEEEREPLLMSVRKRIPWLVILLFLGLLVSAVVGLFEGVVSRLTTIVCFQSLTLSMAGNVGTQSLAVTIRELSDETDPNRRFRGLLFKELRIGFLNGTALGLASAALIGAYLWLVRGESTLFAFATSGCIGIAMMVAMTVSGLTGTAIPLVFRKLGIDPAVASGPLITTCNDLVAVLAYYGLAWALLIQTLHLVG